MKTADGLKTAWAAMTHAMKTDTRFTIDEMAALVIIDAVLDAAGDTTKQQDMVVVQCMQKFVCQNGNY